MKYVANVVFDEETGEHILLFPPESLKEVGWDEGDTLTWIDNGDGSWTIRKLYDGDVNEGLSVGREVSSEDSTGDDTSE